MSKVIKKIVITGGPCAGKSEAIKAIKEHFQDSKWTVLTVPETPTELISGGVAPWTCGSYFQYQICQMELHQKMEQVFLRAAKGMKQNQILIVCDRGQFDCLAYMTQEEFDYVLEMMNVDRLALFESYNAVFYLESVAQHYPEFYTCKNNETRSEDINTAIKIDTKTKAAWENHPQFKYIPCFSKIETKLTELTDRIDRFLKYY